MRRLLLALPVPSLHQDRQAYAVEVLQHLVVPATQHAKSCRLEIAVADGIATRFRMLAAVDFDDQPRLEADEVEDVAVERHLALEFQAFELLVAESLPQDVLGLGRVGPHRAGEGAVGWCDGLAQAGIQGAA